ncbi:MAG TPA: nucleotidyl transferase AbiEii/AbiGii toxin family protein [Candidatus Cloacimonadota bacterium]|nr:nucleotidyl transferase AbiEii/AbiGii toxin family protein [Spirochaetota bacterium]HPM03035.1 nucleotidyl transferase AbiEii/AbiGii toxin family protein [Candidatus Cloacimonadota bacterium]
MDERYISIVSLLLDTLPHVFDQGGFALKGGTAINFFLQDMPRMSVDIDLVYTDHEERDSALKSIESKLNAIADKLRDKLSLDVKSSSSGSDHESKLFITRDKATVKVEVNHVFRGSVYPIVKGVLSKHTEDHFSRSLTVPMLDPDELYASKIVAALDRQHPRDLFDVMLLLDKGGINQRLRRAFTVYLAGHYRPIHELLPPNPQNIKRAFQSEFSGMTTDPDITIEQLENARTQLFSEFPSSLDDRERSFLLSIKRLKPEWDILGIPGIEKLPAIKWKLINIENLSKNNPTKYKKMVKALEERLG